MNDEALIAVNTGNLEKLKELLDQGMKINEQDACGRTLLHHAVSNDQREIIKYLLKNGADVLASCEKNYTALHIAISKCDNNIEKDSIVYDLLENCTRNQLKHLVNRRTKDTGTTVLHIAAEKGNFDNVLILLDRGANYETRNANNKMPIDLVNTDELRSLFTFIKETFIKAYNGDEELLSDLGKINHRIFHSTLYCRNNEGRTMIQLLIAYYHERLARELMILRQFKAMEDREYDWIYGHDRIAEMEELAEQINKFHEFWVVQSNAIHELVNTVRDPQPGTRRPSVFQVNSVSNKLLLICCRTIEQAHEVFSAYRKFSGQKSLTTNQMMKTLEEILEFLGIDPDQLTDETCYYQKVQNIWKKNFLPLIYVLESLVQPSIYAFSQNLRSTRLKHAVIDGNTEKVQQLLSSSPFVDYFDRDSRTVLSYAAETGNKKIVRLLLKAGVPVIQIYKPELPVLEKSDVVVPSPIYLAANNGHEKVVKLLLKNIKAKDMTEFIDCQNVVKSTALHAAAKIGNLDITKTLLCHGATYQIFDDNKRTPLDVTTSEDVRAFLRIIDECFHDAKEANMDLVQKLKALQTDELKAIVNTRNNEGHTLAVVAAKANAKHIAAIILKMVLELKQ